MLSGRRTTTLPNWAVAFIALFLSFFCGNSFVEAFPAADFTQKLQVSNKGGVRLYVGFTQNGTVQLANVVGYSSPAVPGWTNSHNQPCALTPDGNYLIVNNNDYCLATVNWNFIKSYQMCSILPSQASTTPPSGGFYYNCSNGLANLITVVELGTGGTLSLRGQLRYHHDPSNSANERDKQRYWVQRSSMGRVYLCGKRPTDKHHPWRALLL